VVDLSRRDRRVSVKHWYAGLSERVVSGVLLVGLLFAGVYDALLLAPSPADAAYTGKSLRTVEIILGGGAGTSMSQTGSDSNNSSSRASDANVYAGSAWNTTKGTAGSKTLTIPGSGIRVLSAYVDFTAQVTSAANITDLELALDVSPGPAPAVNVNLSPLIQNGTGNVWYAQSSVTQMITAKANATPLFQSQTDGQWNSGITLVGMASVVGPTWNMATMKLVVTYEQDYSTTPHQELKTIRYPLRSTASGNNGTRGSDCAAGNTCSFSYTLDLPDLATTSDVVDAWFEISYIDDATATTTIGISGGATGVEHKSAEAIADNHEHFVIYRPAIGSPNLATTTQQLDVTVAGTAVGALTGEVVVTYKFSTGASTQVETVQYYMGQQLAAPSTATSTYGVTATLSNAGAVPNNIWFKVHAPTQDTLASLSLNARIGASASTSANIYATNGAADSTGVVHYLLDVGAATTSWSGSASELNIAVRQNNATGDAPASVEAFITFRWDASGGGTQTKTGRFFAGMSPVASGDATFEISFPYEVTLPETVTKTLRSSYVRVSGIHSNATSITSGSVLFRVNGSGGVTYTENNTDGDAYRYQYFQQATTTNFTVGSAITGNAFQLFLTARGSVSANEYTYDLEQVVTYDAAFPEPAKLQLLHYRWRADLGSEPLAPFASAEDSSLESGLFPGDRIRLRMLLDNPAVAGSSATSTRFRLEYASTTCTDWTIVPVTPLSGEHWVVDLTEYVPDGTQTTDNAGLSNPGGKTFTGGEVRTASSSASALSIPVTGFSEHEWSIRSTSAVTAGTTYCFRVTNAGSTYRFTYAVTPQISVQPISLRPQGGGTSYSPSLDVVGSGPIVDGGDPSGGDGIDDTGGGGTTGGGTPGGGGDI
jgi:hypothetical protein